MNYSEIEYCVIRAKNGSKDDLLKLMEQYKPKQEEQYQSFPLKI